MTIVNPFLLAGPEQIRLYQENRIKEWEKQKGKSRTDFDHYFSQLVEQWEMDDFNETIVPLNEFEEMDGVDLDSSLLIHKALKKAKILNENGYINLKQQDMESIIDVLNDLSFLSDDQKNKLIETLNKIKANKPQDFETYTKGMFTFLPTKSDLASFKITEPESNRIWKQLNTQGIIDDYGILLLKPKSNDLKEAIQSLTGFSPSQKERVLNLLNQHPELSYHAYIKNFNFKENPALPGAGVYLPDGIKTKQIQGLTKEELNYIRIVSILEWNVMLVSQKTIHKSRKKSNAKVKDEKKKDKAEFEKYLAQMEAKYRQESKERSKDKPKSSGG